MSEHNESLIERAEHLVEIDRWAEAVPLLAKALAGDPDDYRANAMMALCHYSLGNKQEALRFSERTIESEPDEEWGHRLRSLTLLQMGDSRRALESAEEAARIAPYEPYALNALTMALMDRNKMKRAREVAEDMVELAPEMEQSHFTLGNVQLKEQKYWEAERSFRTALSLNPNYADARNNLGIAMLRQEHAPEDNGLFSKAISLSIFAREREVDRDAIEDNFREALKIEPGNEIAAQNLRAQFSYVGPAVLAFAYLPFVAITFSVLPVGAIVMLLFTWWTAGKWANRIKEKRAEMEPEMLAFVRGDKFLGENGPLNRVAGAMWDAVYRTWKPHALALAAAAVNASRFFDTGWLSDYKPLFRFAAVIAMIAASFWLASESRRDD